MPLGKFSGAAVYQDRGGQWGALYYTIQTGGYVSKLPTVKNNSDPTTQALAKECMWPYCGHFLLHERFWSLDALGNHLVPISDYES